MCGPTDIASIPATPPTTPAFRMVFPVEHLTLTFTFPGGTSENAREHSERKPKQFKLLATVLIMAAAGAC